MDRAGAVVRGDWSGGDNPADYGDITSIAGSGAISTATVPEAASGAMVLTALAAFFCQRRPVRRA